MDFLKFIDSGAIREHLREINYTFSTEAAAYVIWQSNHRSMAEKHEAWEYLIANTPDKNVIDWVTREDSIEVLKESSIGSLGFHEFLRLYIKTENEITKRGITNEDGTIFSFRIYYKGDKDTAEVGKVFSSFERLTEAIDEEIEDLSEIKWIFIEKNWLDGEEKSIRLKLYPDKSVFCLLSDYRVRNDREEALEFLFQNMWFKIPTPFKKGDIVYEVPDGRRTFLWKENPFVLKDICYWGKEELSEFWDYTDMTANGYCVYPDTTVDWYFMCNYLALDYYDDEPAGEERLLKAVSGLMQEKIAAEVFIGAYQGIIAENRTKGLVNRYVNRILELAGLKSESLAEKLFPDSIKYHDGLYTIAARPQMGKTHTLKIMADELKRIYHNTVKFIKYEELDSELNKTENRDSADVLIIDDFDAENASSAELKNLSCRYRKVIIVSVPISEKADGIKGKICEADNPNEFVNEDLWDNSDSVIFIYRDNYYDKSAKDNDIKFVIAKGRCEYKIHSLDYDKFKRKASIQGE